MLKQAGILLVMISFLVGCGDAATSKLATTKEEATPVVPKELSYVEQLEKAHKKTEFLAQEAIQFDMVLTFGGSERLRGTMTFTTDSGRGLLDLDSGKKIYFDDDKIFIDPSNEKVASARFAAYTWSYFFLFPYKLSDQGTIWEDFPQDTLRGTKYLTQKLSFEDGTGDAPDDWYIAYANTENHLIEIAAYIVTAGGTTQAEAEVDPHAIEYANYTTVNGVPIAQDWKFWEWREEGGLTKQLGDAQLTNIQFIKIENDLLTPPSDFVQH